MKTFITLIIICKSAFSFAQDSYATIGSINNNILQVTSLSENRAFKVNEKVLVVQMHGNGGALVADTTTKKMVASQVPSKYMIVTVTDVESSEGTVTAIKISRNLQNSFYINNTSSVQLMPLAAGWNW